MAHRRNHVFYIVLFVLTTAILLPALFVFYVDPYQIYHRSRYSNMALAANQRYQNAGLINSYLADPAQGYDSVMIGSSLSDNFRSEDARRYLGWKKTLRLFIDGGNPKELRMIAHHAASKPTTQHILWEIRPRYYSHHTNDFVIDRNTFPAHLYNNERYDDLKYLANLDVIKLAIDAYGTDLPPSNTENLGYWGDDPTLAVQHAQFNAPANLLSFNQTAEQLSQSDWIDRLHDPAYPVIDEELVPIINQYCNRKVQFDLYIPPVTKIDYQSLGARAIYMPGHLVDSIKNCSNFSLHAFDLESFSNDLNNYKDQEHYMPAINKKILELIGNKSNTLTPDNIGDYESKLLKATKEHRAHSSFSS